MAANTLTLRCLVSGDPMSSVFEVKITDSDTDVDDLRAAIFAKKPKEFDNIDANNLVLWRATIPANKDVRLKSAIEPEDLDDKTMLDDSETSLSELFPERPDNTYIIIQAAEPQRKCFKANSTVFLDIRRLVYYADQTESNSPLVQKILCGEFVRVYGARASGKSSRIVDAMESLKNDFECIYLDLQIVNVSSENEFWLSLCTLFRSLGYVLDFKDSDGFREAFSTAQKRWTRPVIIFFDEFDSVHQDNASGVCSSMLSVLRHIRNDPSRGTEKPAHVIHSVVSVGTYAILQLNQTPPGVSPFNSSDNFQNTSLSLDQVGELYREFAKDRSKSIEDSVIEDVFFQSRGHAGLVNICGVALEDRLAREPAGQQISMDLWRSVKGSLLSRMREYGTFQKLVEDLTEKTGDQMPALALYRSLFLGNTSEMTVRFDKREETKLAEFLAALGVLYPMPENNFKIASPLMDSLILQTVMPDVYPNAPNFRPPTRSDDDLLDILRVTTSVLPLFDKELMTQAGRLSYKIAPVRVNGRLYRCVPRESVYDSETIRILVNWLSARNGYQVTGQYHMDSLYCDIVITSKDGSSFTLELVVTETPPQIQKHIEKVLHYKNLISALQGWVIHFTRQDDYLRNPHWQTDEMLNHGVNMIHVWHNESFTEVRLAAKFKNSVGQTETVENERVI